MKIQVEILNKVIEDGVIDYIVDKSKTIEFNTGTYTTRVTDAKAKLDEVKVTLPDNQKIRVLEYRNDEPDKTRRPCKILFEA